MTREEAKKIIFYQWQSFLEHNIDYAGISEAYKMAIKALEQESVIDKIRAEIDLLSDSKCDGNTVTIYSWNGMKGKVFDIIDKYKAESEDKE